MQVLPDVVDDHPPVDEEGYKVPIKTSSLLLDLMINQTNPRGLILSTTH